MSQIALGIVPVFPKVPNVGKPIKLAKNKCLARLIWNPLWLQFRAKIG